MQRAQFSVAPGGTENMQHPYTDLHPPGAASARPRARRPRRTRPSLPHTHPQDNSIDCANVARPAAASCARSGCACGGNIWCPPPAACHPACGAGVSGGANCDSVGAGPLPDIPPPPHQMQASARVNVEEILIPQRYTVYTVLETSTHKIPVSLTHAARNVA